MNESNTSINESPRVPVAQHILRRLAGRALMVIDRHAEKHGAIETYKDTFVPVAEAFMQAYDRTRAADPTRARETSESTRAIEALLTTVQAWGAHLQRDIENLDLSGFRPTASQDDLIARTARLLEILQNRQATEGQALSYGEKVMADLQEAMATAQTERAEAQDTLARNQEDRAEVRRLGHEVQAGLVRLRKTLRAILGSRHRDYQKLRQHRGSVVDEEDPEARSGDAEPGMKVVPPEDSTAEGEIPVVEDEEGEAAE